MNGQQRRSWNNRSAKRLIRLIVWMLPLLMWTGLIFHLSSQTYQQQTIIPWLMKRVDPLTLSMKLPDVEFQYGDKLVHSKTKPYEFVEFIFRKAAHVFVYTILSIVSVMAFRPLPIRAWWKVLLAIGLCLSLSIVDELIQSTTSSRTPQQEDILVDLSGVLVGLLLSIPLLSSRVHREGS